jgi:hypothetical protein
MKNSLSDTYDVLADVADALEGGLLAHLRAGGVRHVRHQDLDEVGPQVLRQLHDGDVLQSILIILFWVEKP